MSRRVRVGECPWCGKTVQLDRRKPGRRNESGYTLTICSVCYACFGNEAVKSRLVSPEELRG